MHTSARIGTGLSAIVLSVLALGGCQSTSPGVTSRPDAGASVRTGALDDANRTELTYQFRQSIEVRDVPSSAKTVRVWLWLPNDEGQSVLDLRVEGAPAGFRVVDPTGSGDRAVVVEVPGGRAGDLRISTSALVRRPEVRSVADPSLAGPITDVHRKAFAEDLRGDVPSMQVTADIRALADRICGSESNVLLQVRALYDHVIDTTDHYSKKTAPASASGCHEHCRAHGGGSCTDMHSLFIALCRARGIPARICFGSRLQPKNEGADHDPGYRCWATFFCPGLGWLPCDVAAGDTVEGGRDAYFGGLDANRLCFVRGRDLQLGEDGPRVNIVTRAAWVEVDGVPHDAFARTVSFRTVDRSSTARAQAAR